jgi:hypothetical protein
MKISKLFSNFFWELHNKKFFFLVAIFSILLNWAGYSFVYENSYNFLYFDMVGTFVTVIVLGSIWGMIVALATAILLSLTTSPHFIYLAIVNMIGALYWGILNECGMLAILKNNSSSFKSSLSSAFSFILFYGIGAGLLTASFSSVVRNVIFQTISFDQSYSLFFANWFRELFNIPYEGLSGLFADYIANTFIEIPDKIITVFFGITICLTIFKFNVNTLTNSYRTKIYRNEIPWHKIMLNHFSETEIIIFLILIFIYLFKIQNVSLQLLITFIEKVSIYSVQNYVFLEILALPIFMFLFLLILKFFLPDSNKNTNMDFNETIKDNFNIKSMDKDIKYFLTDAFCISAVLVTAYIFVLIVITKITPVAYYETYSNVKAKPELLIWLLITVCLFILIDHRNNRITESMTLNDELIKKCTVDSISESFDDQKQKLQVLELNWSDNTIEFLKSARHDLINNLEKSKTGLNELLSEIYDNVVKPYNNLILKNQKEMRLYIEDITNAKLKEYSLNDIEKEIESDITSLQKSAFSYITINFSKFTKHQDLYCKINKLFFIAFNNILDNSVYALQKRVLNTKFNARLNIDLKIETDKTISISISDNAGGLSKDKLSKIYKIPLESSKSERIGEGTVIAKNFIKILNGYISAQNAKFQNDNGLKTVIHIPYFKNSM